MSRSLTCPSATAVRRLSVICLLLLISSTGSMLRGQTTAPATAPTTRPHRYEGAVARFEQRDRETPPPANPTLFIGSSTFTRWREVGDRFAAHTAINRAFGGSSLADLIHFADRIILPYKPKAIVIYCGTNDIAGKTPPDVVFERYRMLTDIIHAELPETQIYFLSIIPAPVRAHLADQMDQANALIRAYTEQHGHLHYIDARHLWSGPDGQPDESLYVADRLHPNEAAYEKLVPVIEAALSGK